MKLYSNGPSKITVRPYGYQELLEICTWYFFNILGKDWIVSTLSGATSKTDTHTKPTAAVKATL
jgi:hypothetical protein